MSRLTFTVFSLVVWQSCLVFPQTHRLLERLTTLWRSPRIGQTITWGNGIDGNNVVGEYWNSSGILYSLSL